MNVALWAAQVLVAAVFLYSAVTKGTWSKQKLAEKKVTGVAPLPLPMIRLVAAAELLGVIGLFGPRLTHIAPVLTPLAAVGLGVIMVGAAGMHLRLREPLTALANLALLALCIFIAIGRFLELN